MKEGGWNLNILQEPACVHLCCTMLHAQSGVADRFINDVKVAVKKVNIDTSHLEPFLQIFNNDRYQIISMYSGNIFPFIS